MKIKIYSAKDAYLAYEYIDNSKFVDALTTIEIDSTINLWDLLCDLTEGEIKNLTLNELEKIRLVNFDEFKSKIESIFPHNAVIMTNLDKELMAMYTIIINNEYDSFDIDSFVGSANIDLADYDEEIDKEEYDEALYMYRKYGELVAIYNEMKKEYNSGYKNIFFINDLKKTILTLYYAITHKNK